MTHDQIEADVRAYAQKLPIGHVHIEIATAAGVNANSVDYGKFIADRIATKLAPIRRRFSIYPNYREI